MAIYLDDELMELPGENLAAVLAAASDHVEPVGRLIVEVHVDGQSLAGDELQQAGEAVVLDREVRLYSAQPGRLAAEALAQVRERLQEARTLQADAAELLQQDDASDALHKVAELVSIWLQTQEAVLQAATLMRISLDDLTVAGEPVPTLIEELIARLQEMKQAITDRDTVALADTLAYEWPQLVDRWDALIGTLIEQVSA